MIPILFETTETTFTSNGLGRLADCTRCEVTEERNGVYELELDYPVDKPMCKELIQGRLIYTTHDYSKIPQAFRIYHRNAPLEGVATVNAYHISYALNNVICRPFSASSCAAAMAGIVPNSLTANPFTFWTDKAVTANFSSKTPKSVRAILGGTEGSLLDVYGKGEYEFDMFTVKLHLNRGADRGVSIRYGKNLTSLDQEIDSSGTYNAVVPYWESMDGEVVTTDRVLFSGHPLPGILQEDKLQTEVPEVVQTEVPEDILVDVGFKAEAMDLSEYFEEAPTVAELEAKAAELLARSDGYEVKENIKISFVQLDQTEEYKDYANLQRVYLCDTVHIVYTKLGINATAKCIKTVYDSLRERYVSMELGQPKTSFAQQIQTMVESKVLQNVPSSSMVSAAIDKATELISGGFGGYIKYHYLSDGTPSEMLIMDSPSEATAVHIIRLNQNGIGFSTDGGTTYSSAWTIDGAFNADFITAGTLQGILLDGNTIRSSSADHGTTTIASGVIQQSFDSVVDNVMFTGVAPGEIRMTLNSTGPDGTGTNDASAWLLCGKDGSGNYMTQLHMTGKTAGGVGSYANITSGVLTVSNNIKIGNTSLSESQLQALLALI